jgi:hypothetical protein
MRKITFYALLTSLWCLALAQNICAQEDSLPKNIQVQDYWAHDKRGIHSGSIGGTQGIAIGTYAGYKHLTRLGVGLNVSGEYYVWNYIGLGWQIGINSFPYSSYSGFEIPLMVKCNVHIMDAANSELSDVLDVYAGLSVGAGPGLIDTDYGDSGFHIIIHAGPQLGIRYWFSERAAVYAELGWGATFANAGFTF